MRWVPVASFLIVVIALGVTWWRLEIPATPTSLAAAASPYRAEWYGLFLVVAAFVLLGLLLFPVLVLIAATGIAFGPVLGPLYAMIGSLACGAAGFAIGRRLGSRRAGHLMGPRMARFTGRMRRNGTLTVFLARKIPAPFTLMNVALGASPVCFRDFVLGTLLSMSAGVVALAGFGSQIGELFSQPSPAALARAALILALSLTAALLINRALRPESPA